MLGNKESIITKNVHLLNSASAIRQIFGESADSRHQLCTATGSRLNPGDTLKGNITKITF